MYVRPISERLFSGRLTPAIRAISRSPLALLVALVLADHQDHAVAADDLAFLAHRPDRWSYLHDPFQAAILPRVGSGCRTGRRSRAGDTLPHATCARSRRTLHPSNSLRRAVAAQRPVSPGP